MFGLPIQHLDQGVRTQTKWPANRISFALSATTWATYPESAINDKLI